MVRKNAVFQYKTIKGQLHKVPALLKLILLLPLSIIVFYLPALWLCFGFFILISLAFISGITFREQLTDLKPALIYTVFLYFLSVIAGSLESWNGLHSLLPQPEHLRTMLRIVLVFQLSALLFRTTSFLEIQKIVRVEAVSLFLIFIPEVLKIWTSIDMAWKARGGKNGINKIKMLVFVLISNSLEKASLKAKAIEARRNNYDK